MTDKKAARHRCNDNRAKNGTVANGSGKNIITEYERGTRIAGWLFCAMFAFLAFGAVVFGW